MRKYKEIYDLLKKKWSSLIEGRKWWLTLVLILLFLFMLVVLDLTGYKLVDFIYMLF